ncbi:TetR/AcrR family transcriptional regulator [Nocardia blacklockiae]|uniref:TetR/AcrR family transcriptional regulator n=1 Tax=Nocardia blacklockiae TaxID=480036 RepID=UPI0018942486|nr:TetR/AcrR family transcriptional regulator [Nocardia blacklockiae]MBF6171078.1 TetR/AcrR family transcriptional regulator [Nocardia blacklockiae]
MARLSRAQSQALTRQRIVAAARKEFGRVGYTAARIDTIADRAGFTRGAVYAHFPSKRVLYLTVLADDAERTRSRRGHAESPDAALATLSRVWLESPVLSLTTTGLAAEIARAPHMAAVFTRLRRLSAVLLSATLHELDTATPDSDADRQARRWLTVADTAVTMMTSHAVRRALDPRHVADVDALRLLTGLDYVPLAPIQPGNGASAPRRTDGGAVWTPPRKARDLIQARTARFDRHGLLVIVGMNRLAADLFAPVLHPPRRNPVTLVLTTRDHELALLARWVVADTAAALRATAARALPPAQVVVDTGGAIAAAAGVDDADDDTEVVAVGRFDERK